MDTLRTDIASAIDRAKRADDNLSRRIAHAVVELLKLDIIELPDLTAEQREELTNELQTAVPALSLTHVQRPPHVYDTIDGIARISAAWLYLIYFGWLCLLCVVLQPLDDYLVSSGVVHPHYALNVLTRKATAHAVLLSSGVQVIVSGRSFSDSGSGSGSGSGGHRGCSIVSYTHASTMDAFLIAAIPPPSVAPVKQELFFVPFFSWMLAAWGGIPINRSDRHAAVKSLDMITRICKNGDTIQIAPEGTRSTTGVLIPFKKGPFYMWESLNKAPIVPMTIFGAFELHPPGSNLSRCGKVYVHYLPAITLKEDERRREGEKAEDKVYSDREVMARRVRRAMLEDIRDRSPSDIAADISWGQRCKCLTVVGFIHCLNAAVCWAVYARHILPNAQAALASSVSASASASASASEVTQTAYLRALLWSTVQVCGVFLGVVVGITAVLYVYVIYIKGPLVRALYSEAASGEDSGAGGSKGRKED